MTAAIGVFWRRGYQATSLDDLTAAMGLSRSSFYACYESKHSALMEAIAVYSDELFAALEAIADAQADPQAAVRAMLTAIAYPSGGRDGCLFVNSVTELAASDAEVAAYAPSHISRVAALMTQTLLRLGCEEALATQRAGALLLLAIGACVLVKAGLPPPQISLFLAQADHLIPAHS